MSSCRVCGGKEIIQYGSLKSDFNDVNDRCCYCGIRYIECTQCQAHVWSSACGWWPTLESDKERWNKQVENRELKTALAKLQKDSPKAFQSLIERLIKEQEVSKDAHGSD